MISLISAVAARLLRGAEIGTPRHVVGPAPLRVAAWACFAIQGDDPGLVRVVEAWREGYTDREQHDWSAFGAASAFCLVERPEAVRKALLDLHRSHCRRVGCKACR